MVSYILIGAILVLALYILAGLKTVRPTQRGLVETFGKYSRFAEPGLQFIFPIFQKIYLVNVTERMTRIEPQEIITQDKLNAVVDLVVYSRINSDETSVKNSVYNVQSIFDQLELLARTSARNVIGTLPFKDVNSERNKLNSQLREMLEEETSNWGIKVLRVELKDINPPKDVQETMNKVIKAENEKSAAVDFATATETKADGEKRAKIKEAEGRAQQITIVAKADAEQIKIVAEANANAIKIINEAAQKYFIGDAQKLKQLEVTENVLKNNSKVILGDSAKGILKLLDIAKQ